MSAALTKRLIQKWRQGARVAGEWASGEDPEPVLDVLALSVALELTGALARVPSAERDALRKVGQRALLQIGGPDRDEDELEALRMCAAIARDGLRALGGKPPPEERAASRDLRVLIPPGDVIRLVRGDLDGFAAGSLAMTIRRSEQAMAELRTFTRLEEPEERPLSLAAAEAAAVLDPQQGRAIGLHPTLGVEAVLFPDAGSGARLAIYAEEPDSLRLVAPELTTEDVREGYWIGRVAPNTVHLRAVLHVGDSSQPWDLSLEE